MRKFKSKTEPRAVKKPKSLAISAVFVVGLACFGYLLWVRSTLIIRSHAGQGEFDAPLEHSTIPTTRKVKKPKTVDTKRAATGSYAKQLADALTESFSTDDGIASGDRMGFEITLSDPNSDSICRCDIISMDCLDTIACMPDLHNPVRRHAMAWIGIELRSAIKATSTLRGYIEPIDTMPLGKTLQYQTMQTWEGWRQRNVLPKGHHHAPGTIFIKPDLYPACLDDTRMRSGRKRSNIKYNGHSCFFERLGEAEDSANTIIEDEGRQWFNAEPEGTQQEVRATLYQFFLNHQPKVQNKIRPQPRPRPSESDSSDSDDTPEYDAQLSNLGHLMLFSHFCRLLFNRRPFLDDIYQDKLTAVQMPGTKNSTIDGDPFIVSVHIRRGDSCGWEGFMHQRREASPLESMAQFGSERLCYRTTVYLGAVRRIRELVPKTRPLHVYLSTDDVGNVMDEILTNTLVDDIVVDKFHYLNYSRSHFNYFTNGTTSIEDEENHAKQPILGETAISDLWLLSHGHAFVGHLGSRFGKVSWLLAMARRNTFVPFFSVDGHSFCCEIDESCALAKPYISVDNCLTFGHEYSDYSHDNYWEEGSVARKKHLLKYQLKKNESQKTSWW